MPALTLKGVPDDLAERLRSSAKANRRSLNGEILTRLEASYRGGPRDDPDEALRELERLHESLHYLQPTTTDEIVAWIRADRDSR